MQEAEKGPGPLIWVVIAFAAIAGALWGIGVAIAVGIATIAIFVLIGMGLERSAETQREAKLREIRDRFRARWGEDLPELTPEVRGVMERMLGRQPQAEPA